MHFWGVYLSVRPRSQYKYVFSRTAKRVEGFGSKTWVECKPSLTTLEDWDMDGRVSSGYIVPEEKPTRTREEQILAQDKEEFPITRNVQRWSALWGGDKFPFI